MSQTTITLRFLVFAIVSFILEKIPLGLTASIWALGLTLTGILDVSTTFSQYVNSNVILCIGMFVVGYTMVIYINDLFKLLISFLFMLFCFFVGIIINIIASKFNL